MASIGKSLEQWVRGTFIRGLRLLPRRPVRSTPTMLPARPRILLLRHDRLGDALVSTPVVALLRERFPAASIDMLFGRKNRGAVPLIPSIDTAIVLPDDGLLPTIRRMRNRRYDVVINLLAKDSASAALMTAVSGARFRIGFAGDIASLYDALVPRPLDEIHIVRETSLLLGPLGIGPISERPIRPAEFLDVSIPEEALERARASVAAMTPDNRLRILLNVSVPSEDRSWPDQRFIELIPVLDEAGFAPMIAGIPSDVRRLERIGAATGIPVLPVTGSLVEFVAMLGQFDMIVTPHTSVVHMAAAMRRPTVMLNTSSSSDSKWIPWGVPRRVVLGGATVTSISVTDVAAAIQSLALEISENRSTPIS